jgi:hypothetical protein
MPCTDEDASLMIRTRDCALMFRSEIVLLFTLAVTQLASAKRIAPANVDPITYEGIRYVAPNDDGRRGYVEAWDAGTNKKLWELTVFTNHIDPNFEEDLQWVFIKSLNIQDSRLLITREDGRTYQLDLNTNKSRNLIQDRHGQQERLAIYRTQ